MTGKVLLRKHVTFCRMSVSAVYHSKIGEVCVCESGLITRLNVFQDRLLALGWVQDETGPRVHMLWHRRSKRWKSVWRCRDRWTRWHICAWKVGRAGRPTPGCRSTAFRNRREGMSADVHLFVCESLHYMAKSMWTTLSTQFCVVLLWACFYVEKPMKTSEHPCKNHSLKNIFRYYFI